VTFPVIPTHLVWPLVAFVLILLVLIVLLAVVSREGS
jgi:hypothetical protein